MRASRLIDSGPVGRLAAIGHAPGDDADTRLRKSTLTLTAASIAVVASAWTLAFLALGRPLAASIPLLYQVMATLSLILLARTKRDDLVRALHIGFMLVLPVVLQWTLGGFVNASAVMIWAFAAPLGALVFMRLPVAIATFGVFAAATVLSGLLDPLLEARAEPLPDGVVRVFFVLNVVGLASIVFLVLAYFVRERHRALDEIDVAHRALQAEQAELQAEQARSDSLLRNILPDAIAERLKAGDRFIADRHEAVSVVFVDIVDFTPLAARLSPADLVRFLDRIFVTLEELCERHGLEKIKTAGDSFVAVAGLPGPRAAEAGAIAAAEMSLAVFPAIEQALSDLHGSLDGLGQVQLRIGIHTGPVVAGVIGRRKFAYDLWGDAVNVASRMESQGMADRIQVSLVTYEYLQQHYRFRHRGTIEVKGRGDMGAYLLLERRAAHLQADLSNHP